MQIYNTAPNGLKTDIITLTEVPNADGSGMELKIEFQSFEFMDKKEVGQVSLIDGVVWFSGGTMSHIGMRLLSDWLTENIEKDEDE